MPERINAFILPYWKSLSFILLLNVCSTVLIAVQPLFGKWIIDQVFIERAYSFSKAMTVAIACMFIGFLLFLTIKYSYLHISLKITKEVKSAMYDRLLKANSAFLSKQRAGDTISRLHEDAGEAQRLYTDGVMQLVVVSVGFLIDVSLLVYLEWRMALFCFGLLPLLLGVTRLFRRLLYRANMRMRTMAADNQSFLFDTLSSPRFIRGAGLANTLTDKYRVNLNGLNKQQIKLTLLASCAQGIPQGMILASAACTVWFLGVKVLAGALSLGTLLAFGAYQAKLFASAQGFAQLYIRLQKGRVAVERAEAILRLSVDRDGDEIMHLFDSHIAFDNVGFSHEKGIELFSDVSFSIARGEKIGIIGPNGAGKSTLADLLVRVQRPSSGIIRCDGVDIQAFTRESWHRRVCLIAHDHPLWHGTIEEFLQVGKEPISGQRMWRMLEAVGLKEAVAAMSDGLKTQVGERGTRLSAGMKQRLILAWAFLQEADIFILDEATCHLDAEGEGEIFNFIQQELQNQTVIIIAHRIQNLAWVDRLWTLESGSMIQIRNRRAERREAYALEREHG
ncbi:ABC transporter ATP-binding protein [Aneurinibacillus aneurinilyticus]|uniref:ABC transporter ATP-binding protein n=1 Tax=Aneurinibacillus aneurinilyticus TaxID=1391 RepID=UPI0023F49A53|nr:ABC transporter ATP-binding protein [Aneurinibacillus aneurinilyticus]MED0668771.1 ABC transporter ATP-binding protein [Aneurinibacillus aneurinilyticus]